VCEREEAIGRGDSDVTREKPRGRRGGWHGGEGERESGEREHARARARESEREQEREKEREKEKERESVWEGYVWVSNIINLGNKGKERERERKGKIVCMRVSV